MIPTEQSFHLNLTDTIKPSSAVVIEEYKSVGVLKEFWKRQILATNIDSKIKSATLKSSTITRNFNNLNNQLSSYGKRKSATLDSANKYYYPRYSEYDKSPSSTSSLLDGHNGKNSRGSDISLNRIENLLDTIELKKSIDNFNKFKTADLVKTQRSSLDVIERYYKHYKSTSTSPESSNRSSIQLSTASPPYEKFYQHENTAVVVTGTIIQNEVVSNEKVLSNYQNVDNKFDKKSNLEQINISTNSIPQQSISPRNSSTGGSDPNSPYQSDDQSVSSSKKIARKISFRTYPTQPRKTRSGTENVESKVAILTNQFNQLLQKDAALLEEVKKKGAIVYKTNKHVYKIFDKEYFEQTKTDGGGHHSTSSFSSVGRSSKRKSKKKLENENIENVNNVKDKIEKFEPNGAKYKLNKPKVPDKSDRVLRKTKEINKNVLNNESDNVFNEIKDSHIPIEKIEVHNDEVNNEPEPVTLPTPSKNNNNNNVELEINSNETLLKIIEECDDFYDSKIEITENNNFPTRLEESSTFSTSDETIFVSSENYATLNSTTKDKLPKSRSNVERIYEKIRLKLTPNKKEQPRKKSPEPTIDANLDNPDKKIVDAICSVNQKIEQLSRSENDLRIGWNFHERIEPNASFLFRSASKQSFTTSSQSIPSNHKDDGIVEAINTCLISKTQSMDETKFPSAAYRRTQTMFDEEINNIFRETDDLITKIINDYKLTDNSSTNNNGGYEPISNPNDRMNEDCSQSQINKIPIMDEKYITEDIIVAEKMYDTPKRKNSSSIYQWVSENLYAVPSALKKVNVDDMDSERSYESFDNYESVHDRRSYTVNRVIENGYEAFDNNTPPEPPPPRKISQPAINNSTTNKIDVLTTTKTNKLCNKRKTNSPNYEKIKYDSPRSPPNQQDTQTEAPPLPATSPPPLDTEFEIDSINIVVENNRHCYDDGDDDAYDMMRHTETQSIQSNFYESIGSAIARHDFIRLNMLNHSDSMSTISSEQKTNSLYGLALGQSITPPNGGSPDPNDEWIDISDDDDHHQHRDQVIVTRQRVPSKTRFSDWTRKICDHDQQQQLQEIYNDSNYEDDLSGPLYESLNLKGSRNDKNSSIDYQSGGYSAGQNIASNGNLHSHITEEDDFDSFDSDGGIDDEVNKTTDSGVDISNTKLPEPPQPQSQVYVLMQKIISPLSDSISSFVRSGKRKTSTSSRKIHHYTESQKKSISPYERNDFSPPALENPKSSKSKSHSRKSKGSTTTINNESDSYENINYDNASLRTTSIYGMNQSSSPKILQTPNSQQSTTSLAENHKSSSSKLPAVTIQPPEKTKRNKSIRSKFRKSFASSDNLNIGKSLNGTRSTFYISDSVDVDSGIFAESNDRSTQSQDDLNISSPDRITPQDYSSALQPQIVAPNRTKSKLTRSPELNRRKSSTSSGRPKTPPPPPPPIHERNILGQQQNQNNVIHNDGDLKQRPSSTWYAETQYKNDTTDGDKSGNRKERNSNTSWYAEIYQSSGDSIGSSSGSSGVSTGGEGGPGEDNVHSMFLNEPLYQIYNAAKLESISSDVLNEYDGYEEVGRALLNGVQKEESKKNVRPSAFQLIEPKHGPSRTLWCDIPEVKNSGILESLSTKERKVQEAKFEILTSEASYLKSLNLLRSHFINHTSFRNPDILSPANRKCLFSNIISVLQCSERLLSDLETCWQDNFMLVGLNSCIHNHVQNKFKDYVQYCEHQGKMDRLLKKLKDQRGAFAHSLEQLESDPICCGLSLHSFLMLPMQRITRFPLLVMAVLDKMNNTDDEYDSWNNTLVLLNKTAKQCNDAADRSEQAYELEAISRFIEFPTHITPITIVPIGLGARPRSLVRKGELLLWKHGDSKLTFSKKFTKQQKDLTKIYAFLFTDLLVLTKKKTDGKFQVTDYCQRSMLTVHSGNFLPQHLVKDIFLSGKHWILMTLLENHEKKTVEMIVLCNNETERERWIQAAEPPASENPEEKLYEIWDCPQVVAIHEYQAMQPDEIGLNVGEVVNVLKKMADGWCHGERLRDGQHGWFPGNYTKEVASSHVRARNLKQRQRLLVFSANYLESQKGGKI